MSRTISIIILLLLPAVAFGADWHVRPNGGSYGAEDGTDWTNAFDGFSDINWGAMAVGDDVYVAGGTYTQGLSPTIGGVPGNHMTVVRATSGSHGTDTGWNAAYASTVYQDISGSTYPIVLGGSKDISYVTVDGATWQGWEIDWACSGGGYNAIDLDVSSGYASSHFTIRNIRIDGTNNTNANGCRGVWLENSTYGSVTPTYLKHVLIEYVEFDNITDDPILFRGVSDTIIQHNTFGHRKTGGGHGDALEIWQSNRDIEVRWNKFIWNGQNIFFNGYSGDAAGNLTWNIHNNLFYNDGTWNNGTAQITIKTQSWNPTIIGPINFFNNTIVNNERLGDMKSNVVEFNVFNNISYDNDGGGASLRWGAGATSDYNYYEQGYSVSEANNVVGSDPFVNYTAYDFDIHSSSTAIGAGVNLGEDYDTDYYGKLRDPVGAWDLGAVKFANSGDEVAPMPPMQLNIFVNN